MQFEDYKGSARISLLDDSQGFGLGLQGDLKINARTGFFVSINAPGSVKNFSKANEASSTGNRFVRCTLYQRPVTIFYPYNPMKSSLITRRAAQDVSIHQSQERQRINLSATIQCSSARSKFLSITQSDPKSPSIQIKPFHITTPSPSRWWAG